ncbi:response regulator [Paraburkholderia phymatum]|uniref:response regulator transcription factor n=1 Tax=Paraburkholderia phymatum TaxID=148447 RepID=UPI00316D8558
MRNTLISIIDDDESVRLSLASLVRSLGAEARTFPSVQNFLSSGVLEQCACIVSDVEMPQLSGIDMQLLLEQHGYSIPVIFITALWNDSARKVAISHGASCYLEKPLDAQTFENALNQVLGPDV